MIFRNNYKVKLLYNNGINIGYTLDFQLEYKFDCKTFDIYIKCYTFKLVFFKTTKKLKNTWSFLP